MPRKTKEQVRKEKYTSAMLDYLKIMEQIRDDLIVNIKRQIAAGCDAKWTPSLGAMIAQENSMTNQLTKEREAYESKIK